MVGPSLKELSSRLSVMSGSCPQALYSNTRLEKLATLWLRSPSGKWERRKRATGVTKTRRKEEKRKRGKGEMGNTDLGRYSHYGPHCTVGSVMEDPPKRSSWKRVFACQKLLLMLLPVLVMVLL